VIPQGGRIPSPYRLVSFFLRTRKVSLGNSDAVQRRRALDLAGTAWGRSTADSGTKLDSPCPHSL
jgi:hypothetical protein